MKSIVVWGFPTRIVFGAGAVSETGSALEGCRHALIVTDAGVKAAGLIAPVVGALGKVGIEATIFDGVKGNPKEAHVDAGFAAYREAEADCVVAVGGGSPMDAAKVIALRVNHHRPLVDYDDAHGGDRYVTDAVPPIVAVPTTAGTGSEVGRAGVVTVEATGRKTVIFHASLLPKTAILDPALTTSMPAQVTAATGYDALTHCLEAFVAASDHPMCDGIALRGIGLVHKSLRRAVSHGDDLEARGDMMKAAMMGAVAFQKGLGACHSLAHPLGSQCDLHHGLANAICLPEVVRFNLETVKERYAEVAGILGGTADATACAGLLEELRKDLDLAASLEEAGLTEVPLDALADEAIEDGCHRSNPRTCTRADLRDLYERVR